MSRCALVLLAVLTVLLAGCSTLGGADSPNVRVVGLEPLPNEGLEMRFALKLRVQNPNDATLLYDGLSVNLDLDGRGLASGVSNVTGEIPRFSESVITVPVSVSAFTVLRQILARAGNADNADDALIKPIHYSLRGKLGSVGGGSAVARFSDKGALDLFPLDQQQLTPE